MANPPCDMECGEPATLAIQDLTGGGVTFVDPLCYVLAAIELAKLQWPTLLTDAAAGITPPADTPQSLDGDRDGPAGPVGSDPPKTRTRRKRDPVPAVDFDEHRVIGEVVESAPRPPELGPDGIGDAAADQYEQDMIDQAGKAEADMSRATS